MGARDYGSDAYWIDRYEKRGDAKKSKKRTRDEDDDDVTDEWLLSWAALRPLLLDRLRPYGGANIIDLGCGTSALPLDMLRDVDESTRVTAVDIARGAIEYQSRQRKLRLASGESSACRACFSVVDVTLSDAQLEVCDVSIDKSTTDGLLCDVDGGAARVRAMYTNLGGWLRRGAPALVAVCSWRDPEDEDGLAWLLDLVLSSVRSGAIAAGDATSYAWSLDIHTLVSRGGGRGPHVYLLGRRPRRRSARLSRLDRRASGDDPDDADEEEEIRMRHHVHEEA